MRTDPGVPSRTAWPPAGALSMARGASASSGIDVTRERGRIGVGTRLREFERGVDRRLRALRDRRAFVRGEPSGGDDLGGQPRDRIALAPRVDLVLRAVEIPVALRVAAQAVSLAFDERGPTARARAL